MRCVFSPSASALAITVALMAPSTQADCSPGPTAGDDNITCDNGAGAGGDLFAADGDDEITLTGGDYDQLMGEGGNDSINLTGGSASDVFGDGDNDTITLDGARIDANIIGGSGDDSIDLISGSVLDVFGDGNDDTVTVEAGFNLGNMAFGSVLNGDGFPWSGSVGTADVLNFDASGTMDAGRLLNWEQINLTGDLELTSAALSVATGAGLGFDIDGGALSLGGNFALTGKVTNNGTLSLGGAAGTIGNDVEITGNLSGNGGLVLDVDAGIADRLVAARAITGNRVLTLNVAPGAVGTATMGDGIELVSATDLAGASFSLGAPVVVGIYSYGLAVVGNSVFLQSALAGQFSGYAVMGEVIRDTFPTLRERLGDRLLDADRNVWARVNYDNRRVRPDSAGPLTGGDWDERRTEIAVGTDVTRMPFGDGELIASLGVHVVGGRATTLGATTAAADADGLGLNGALTWFGAGGTYVDVQARVTRCDISSGAGATSGETNGQSWGLPVEVGQSLTLGEATVTPRVQLIYGESRLDRFTDSTGSTVEDGGGDTTIVSTGVTYERTVAGGTTIFADASLFQDLADPASVTANGTEIRSGAADRWGKLAIGTSMPVGGMGEAYLSAQGTRSLERGNGSDLSLGLTAGLKLRF